MARNMFQYRLPECSSCAPDDCPKTARPGWCEPSAPFEPEGILSGLATIVTTWLGMHFGLTLIHARERQETIGSAASTEMTEHESGSDSRVVGTAVLSQWFSQSLFLCFLGSMLDLAGLPMNKQLWSPSYAFFMASVLIFRVPHCQPVGVD